MKFHPALGCALFVSLILSFSPAEAARSGKARLLVTFAETSTKDERAQAAKDMGLAVAEDLEGVQSAILESAGDVAPQEVDRARKHPASVGVEEDVYRNWLFEEPVPVMSAATTSVPWGVARVNAPAAWPRGKGAGIKVAVVDTGIDCGHPDLRCDYALGTNIVDPGVAPLDDNEHGSHVSGTIAGRGLSGGPLGIAPEAVLVPVKVLDRSGSGRLSDIVKGISWAAEHGADVINLSLGGDVKSAAMERAVKNALQKGIVIVAAAGNSGPSSDTVGFPAGYPGVIAVAASDKKDVVAPFSSRGSAVAFIAPGVKILSTVPGGYAILSGTSMASPHVAGLAALALERGARGAPGVRAALKKAAKKLPEGSAAEQGAGMIDAASIP
jgi:subtilisin